jgi:hypothetical protein
MKRFLVGAALAVVSASGASAETVFIGNVFLDSVAGDSRCASTFAVNDFARAIFRPRGGALGNGGDSQFAYVTTRSAFVMLVQNGDFKLHADYSSVGVGGTANTFTAPGEVTAWKQGPKSVGSATPTVSISGEFTRFFGLADCNVGLHGNFILR